MPASCTGCASSIEHSRQPHPLEVAFEAGAPDHCCNVAFRRVQRADRRIRKVRSHGLGWIDFRSGSVEALACDVIVNVTLEHRGGLVPEADVVLQVVREAQACPAVLNPGEAAEEHDT